MPTGSGEWGPPPVPNAGRVGASDFATQRPEAAAPYERQSASEGAGVSFAEGYAEVPPWVQRVAAHLLDAVVVFVVAVLLDAVLPFDFPYGLLVPLPMLAAEGFTGWTPGKLILGMRLVDAAGGGVLGPWRSMARYPLHLLDWILCVGFIAAAFTRYRQTFADMLVGSVVATARSVPWARGGGSVY